MLVQWLRALSLGLCVVAGGLGISTVLAEDQPKPEEKIAAPQQAGPPKIQVAILLDTSNSMDGLIAQAKSQLWKIVNEFATVKQNGKAPKVEVALYEYGKQSLPAQEHFLRMVVPLTEDLDKVSEELFKLTTNGGEEYCGAVIEKAVASLQWSNNPKDLKCIFIAGNEPFTQGPIDFRKSCKAAADKGITVSTIFCGNTDEGVRTMWLEGSKLADGSYMSINQNEVLPAIAAPQDKELEKLSGDLNKTYLPYGKAEARLAAKDRQVQQDSNAAGAQPGAAQQRAGVKASGLYNNAHWDLVDALREKLVKLEDVKEEDLPDELKKLTPAERKALVEKMQAQRLELQGQIKKLNTAREEHVNNELKKLRADKTGTLDKVISEAARKQAEAKGFEYVK